MTRHEHHWQPFSALAPFSDIPLFWCPACKIVMDTAAVADYGRMWQENAALREIVATVAGLRNDYDGAWTYNPDDVALVQRAAHVLLAGEETSR